MPLRRIRVLVVDDSVVLRRLIRDALASEPSIEVVATAANGSICLAKIPGARPDLVILDVEMPVLDGLETLRQLRRAWPTLPVILFSGLTSRVADMTLEALSLGACDYVPKPSGSEGREDAMRRVREALVPRVRLFAGLPAATAASTATTTNTGPSPHPASSSPLASPRSTTTPGHAPQPAPGPRLPEGRIDIVAIGTSTGGPDALALLLAALGEPLPVPIVIVQHMPPVFTRSLAARLTTKCHFPVHEAAAGDLLVPGEAWIAPGDFHMTVVRQGREARVGLHQGPPENSCRPAVDVLFRSLPAAYASHVLAVVMTGMGQDGLRGCEEVRAAAGHIVVQDQASSVVWGMPGAVFGAGLADKTLPLDALAAEITRRAAIGRASPAARTPVAVPVPRAAGNGTTKP